MTSFNMYVSEQVYKKIHTLNTAVDDAFLHLLSYKNVLLLDVLVH